MAHTAALRARAKELHLELRNTQRELKRTRRTAKTYELLTAAGHVSMAQASQHNTMSAAQLQSLPTGATGAGNAAGSTAHPQQSIPLAPQGLVGALGPSVAYRGCSVEHGIRCGHSREGAPAKWMLPMWRFCTRSVLAFVAPATPLDGGDSTAERMQHPPLVCQDLATLLGHHAALMELSQRCVLTSAEVVALRREREELSHALDRVQEMLAYKAGDTAVPAGVCVCVCKGNNAKA